MKSKKTEPKTEKILKHQFYSNNRITFIIAMAGNIGIGILNLVISWFFQQLLDVAAGNETIFDFTELIMLWNLITILLVISYLLVSWAEPRFRRRAISQYRSYAFELISKKSASSFRKESVATYLSAMTTDVASIETNYLCSILSFPVNIIFAAGAIIFMFWYNVKLATISLIIILIPIVLTIVSGKKLPKYDEKTSVENSNFVNTLKDILNGFQVIKSFHSEEAAQKLFEFRNFEVGKFTEKSVRTRKNFNAINGSSSFFSQGAIFVIGTWMASHGEGVTAGMIWVFLQLTGLAIDGINALPVLCMNYKAASTLINNFSAHLDSNVQRTGIIAPNKLCNNIILDNLCYTYLNQEVLHNVNYTFHAGGCYAIVGTSGSGKSTLLNVMQGALPDYEGTVSFDGRALSDIQPDTIFNLISIIHQEIIIFNATLKDNITMFSDFEPADIEKVLYLSGLQSLWESRGADYFCGENGCNLSGGERQRIAIARCLLRKTPVLLSDEATASLDTATSNEINKVLLSLEGITRIFVTHTLDEVVLKGCTSILVMHSGNLVESGTFEELTRQKGYFYSLYTVTHKKIF